MCLGTGYLLAGFATELWHYLLAVGLLGGIGAAALGMIVASALLSRWFTRRIGSIMSLPYAAIGAGMLVLPPLTQLLVSVFDWRITHRLIGSGVLATLPLMMLLPLSRFAAGSNAWQLKHAAAAAGAAQRWWSLSTALRTAAFWGLFVAYLFTAAAAYSVTPHSVAYLVVRGFEPLFAASAFGLTGMLSAIGIIGMGLLSDRIGRRQAVTVSYLSTVIGIVALSVVSLRPSQLLVYAFVIFFGLMQGARADHRRHGHCAVSWRRRCDLWRRLAGPGVRRRARFVVFRVALRADGKLRRLLRPRGVRGTRGACIVLGGCKPPRGEDQRTGPIPEGSA